MTAIQEQLAGIVAAEHVAVGDASHAVGGVVPGAFAAPATREEAAAIINLCRERGWALVPRGGGTAIETGFPPARLDLVLSTHRLDRVVDYQPDDMTVTVEPGLTLAALQSVLAERGQFLPLDPPLPQQATVGGIVAAASSGPWRAAYGTPRDWVIGCRVIGADGKLVRGGGQVVKNVAGYDLPKLYTGSYGTLGLIVEVTFKVMPRPESRGYALAHMDSAAEAEALVARVLASDLQPSAVELASRVVQYSPWSILFELQHVREAIGWQLDTLAGLWPGLVRMDEVVGATLLEALRDWAMLSSFAARIGTVSSRVGALAEAALELAAATGVDAQTVCQAATGQVGVGVGVGAANPGRDFADGVRAIAREAGASCTFSRLPESLRGQVDPWGEPGSMRLVREIKSALDPGGMFSPGRFIGRL